MYSATSVLSLMYMTDLIPGIVFTDTEKQVYGAIAGAILGALFGALSTYWLSNRERKKQIDLHEVDRRRQTFLDNNTAMINLQYLMQGLLVTTITNLSVFEDYKSGLFKDGDKEFTTFQINSPSEYKMEAMLGMNIHNNDVQVHWMNMMTEMQLQNTIVTEFNDYYKSLRSDVHTMLLNGNQPSRQVIESDNNTILLAVRDGTAATELFKNKALKVLSMIEAFADYYSKINTREFTTAKQFRDHLDEMFVFSLGNTEIKKYLKANKARFTKEQILGHVGV